MNNYILNSFLFSNNLLQKYSKTLCISIDVNLYDIFLFILSNITKFIFIILLLLFVIGNEKLFKEILLISLNQNNIKNMIIILLNK
jgi:hypothetical protein